jgi:hypothetical protein
MVFFKKMNYFKKSQKKSPIESDCCFGFIIYRPAGERKAVGIQVLYSFGF